MSIAWNLDPGRRRPWGGKSWTQPLCLTSRCYILGHCVSVKHICVFCCRVVVKERAEKCPSHSSVYSESCVWSNCSAKEKASEHSSGLLSSRSRSVNNTHSKKGWLRYVDMTLVKSFPLFCSGPALCRSAHRHDLFHLCCDRHAGESLIKLIQDRSFKLGHFHQLELISLMLTEQNGLFLTKCTVFYLQTFGKVAIDDNTHINRNCNFQTFFMAVLVLFRWDILARKRLWLSVFSKFHRSNII